MHSFIVRKIDDLGRVVLPKEWRDLNNIKERDPIELHVEGRTVTLKKHEDGCVFCGNRTHLEQFNNLKVCKKCVNSLIVSFPRDVV